MPDLANELEKIILKAGIDGALTEDAVAQFHALVTERNALKDDLKDTKRQLDVANEHTTKVNAKYSEAVQSNDAWATREKELKDREDSCLRLEIEKECAEKRVDDHIGMVKLVLRNESVRRTSFGQELTHQPGSPEMKDQYGNIQQYHTPAGFEATPVKKEETEEKE